MENLNDLESEHVASVSAQALQLMAQLDVPVTPANFTVWFAYVLGRSPALRKTIDILRSNKRRFDKTLNRELHSTLLGSSSFRQDVDSISEELGTILAHVRDDLSGAIVDNSAQTAELTRITARMADQCRSTKLQCRSGFVITKTNDRRPVQ